MGSKFGCELPARCASSCIVNRIIVHPVGKGVDSYYKLEVRLAEGGYSVVYKARSLKGGRALCACKSVDKEKMPNEAQLRAEVDILSMLQSGKGSGLVVKLFEVFEDTKKIHLILELCLGGELYERHSKVGKFKEAESLLLLRQMLRAIDHLQGHNVIHRDLKLENWFLMNPEGYDIKLGDFGLSAILLPGERACLKVGSPYYVAPEVLKGDYDARADMWSLGVIFYMLVGGRPPFNGSNPAAILTAVRNARVPIDVGLWAAATQSARELLLSLLAVDPSERPAPVDALSSPWILEDKSYALKESL